MATKDMIIMYDIVWKGDGGAVGLTENPAALRRWMVSGPEMARLI